MGERAKRVLTGGWTANAHPPLVKASRAQLSVPGTWATAERVERSCLVLLSWLCRYDALKRQRIVVTEAAVQELHKRLG